MTCTLGNSYIIKAGDTLQNIAARELGDGNRWNEIIKVDGIHFTDEEARHLQVDQEVCIHGEEPSPPSGKGFANIVSLETYKLMFPQRASLYTYDSLVQAAQKYPSFCNEGSDEQIKREAAAFLANVAHETGNLQHTEELNTANWPHYCDPTNSTYPCAQGKTYQGRGPIQLSWNYNYGACGEAIGIDLIGQPELVSSDSVITFLTALWFWMTPQSPKASCHDAINTSGFGMTIFIINGGIECGTGQVTEQAQHRIQLYQQFAEKLGATPGENLFC